MTRPARRPGQMRAFIKKYQCSASWMAEQIGIDERSIQRINAGSTTRMTASTWKAFLELLARVERGEIPPTRQERRDEEYERQKGVSGYWGVSKEPLLGTWCAYFQHKNIQRKMSGCRTQEQAIQKAEQLAEKLGCKPSYIGTSQLKSLKKPWRAYIYKRVDGCKTRLQIGHFRTAKEAARAHDEEARSIGQTKRLNFPE